MLLLLIEVDRLGGRTGMVSMSIGRSSRSSMSSFSSMKVPD